MTQPNGTVVLRPIEAEGIGTRRLFKCALASVYNNPSSLFGRDGIFSAIASSVQEDLTVIYAKHGAIQVHGIFLDYCAEGLEVCMDEKGQEESLKKYNEKFEFQTDRTRQELIAWVYGDHVQDKYRAEKYRAGTNNCIHFVYECLQFLEAPVPEAIQKMIKRLNKYGPLLELEPPSRRSNRNVETTTAPSTPVNVKKNV